MLTFEIFFIGSVWVEVQGKLEGYEVVTAFAYVDGVGCHLVVFCEITVVFTCVCVCVCVCVCGYEVVTAFAYVDGVGCHLAVFCEMTVF